MDTQITDVNWYVKLRDDAERTALETSALDPEERKNFVENFDYAWDQLWGRGIFLADWYYFYLCAESESDAVSQARALIANRRIG